MSPATDDAMSLSLTSPGARYAEPGREADGSRIEELARGELAHEQGGHEAPRRRRGRTLPRPRTPLALDRVCEGMLTVRVAVAAEDVVFVKGVLEASEGVAAVFSEGGGDLTLATTPSQHAALRTILDDLGLGATATHDARLGA
jgi:hypothetical protein